MHVLSKVAILTRNPHRAPMKIPQMSPEFTVFL